MVIWKQPHLEGIRMAHGSLRQMRRYAHKVFEKDARRGRMSERRRDPTLSLAAVLATWQWGLIRQTPSTEQIGELLAALRLLQRLLSRLRKSLDLILGDALYCCRPFFQAAGGAGREGLAISSGQTEMDEEIELLQKTDPPRTVRGINVAVWEMESKAWRPQLKRKLRVSRHSMHRRVPIPCLASALPPGGELEPTLGRSC